MIAFGIYEDTDLGTILRETVPTEDRAAARVRILSENERRRWMELREIYPQLPREACSYFSYRRIRT